VGQQLSRAKLMCNVCTDIA